MKFYTLKISTVVIFLFVFACKKEDAVSPSKKSEGYFVLSQASYSGRLSDVKEEIQEFDLGDVRSSRSFGFSLLNGGDYAITDIQFQTDDKLFIFTPSAIKNLQSGSGLTQSISLDVIHGKAINGSVYSDLLPMNENIALLTISGKTLDVSGTEKQIYTFAKLKVSAKLMDIAFFVEDNEIRLDTNYGICLACDPLGGNMRNYWTTDTKMSLKNTGNVSIKVKYTNFNGKDYSNSKDLEIGSSIDFDLKEAFGHIRIELDGSNTMTNSERINLSANGKGYLDIMRITQ